MGKGVGRKGKGESRNGGNEVTTEGEREGDKDTHRNTDGQRDMYARRKTKGEREEREE